jgi:hypothetical protein
MPKRSSKKRPGDVNQLAKALVGLVTGNPITEDISPIAEKQKNPAAVELGRLGGKKGGNARAAALTPERRKEIAKKAAQSRWKKSG